MRPGLQQRTAWWCRRWGRLWIKASVAESRSVLPHKVSRLTRLSVPRRREIGSPSRINRKLKENDEVQTKADKLPPTPHRSRRLKHQQITTTGGNIISRHPGSVQKTGALLALRHSQSSCYNSVFHCDFISPNNKSLCAIVKSAQK